MTKNIKIITDYNKFIWPQRAAHNISELNLFLYLRISGVSEPISWLVGVTLTLTWLSLRDGPPDPAPPAPNPNVKKLRCFCCKGRNWFWGSICWWDCCGDAPSDGVMKDLEGVEPTEEGGVGRGDCLAWRYCYKHKHRINNNLKMM